MTKILLFDIEPYYRLSYNKETGECEVFSDFCGKNRKLSVHKNNNGYYQCKVGSRRLIIHQFITEKLISRKKKGFVVNHKDCNKLNNSLENLEYVTIAENIKHAVLNGMHVSSDPKRSGRYKDGRAIKSRIKEYKHEWYEKNKNKNTVV